MKAWYSLLDPRMALHASPSRLVGGAMGTTAGKANKPLSLGIIRHQIQRRRAIAELEGLSDQLLSDIGLMRHEVADVVDTMIARELLSRADDSDLAA